MTVKAKKMTVDEFSAILNTVAKDHQTDLVLFTTSSKDGTIRPRDRIDVYIRNNGNMGWLDLGHFAEDTQALIGRKAMFHSLPSNTRKADIKALNGICAYSLVAHGRLVLRRLCRREVLGAFPHTHDERCPGQTGIPQEETRFRIDLQSDLCRCRGSEHRGVCRSASHLPYEFWGPLRKEARTNRDCTDFLHAVELLVAIRNNIAHCYLRAKPDYDLIHSTANSDLPYIHGYVTRFYDEQGLSEKRSEYATGLKVPVQYKIDGVSRVERCTDLISENIKPRRKRHR